MVSRNDLILIAAVDKQWGIGFENNLLKPIPEDLKRFSQFTRGNIVVYGRKTMETFPQQKALPNRTNLLLTHNMALEMDDVIILHNLQEFFDAIIDTTGDIYVIGGDSVYRQLIDFCDRAYITQIDDTYQADAYLPNLDKDIRWQLTEEGPWQDSRTGVRFRYCTYTRREL